MKWGLCLLFALGAAFLLGLVLFILAGRRAPAYRAEAQIIHSHPPGFEKKVLD
jgi:hypothetical protein